MKYRTRPVEVEAMQWTDRATEVVRWIEERGGRVTQHSKRNVPWLVLATPDGPYGIDPGDWVVRFPNGHFRRMNAAQFRRNYEPVEDA